MLLAMTAHAAAVTYPPTTCPSGVGAVFPTTLTNGQPADADQVMSNFNWLQQCGYFPNKVGIGTSNPQATLDVNGTIMGASRSNTGVSQRICSGQTTPGATNWQNYLSTTGIHVYVDTSGCGFTQTPIYIPSLAGDSGNWVTTGGSSPYERTTTGFRIYLHMTACSDLRIDNVCGAGSPNAYNWHINWIAIGQ